MWLLVALIAIPLIEIGLFIEAGGLIGLWPTLALVLLAAMAGLWVIRMQGIRATARLRAALNGPGNPAEPLGHGALIVLAGVLLLVPGFFTDALGLLLLVPPVRRTILRRLGAQVRVAGFAADRMPPRHEPWRPEVIDGEFQEVEPGELPRRPSGWRRH
jgi:UPF0716 protein FxsA